MDLKTLNVFKSNPLIKKTQRSLEYVGYAIHMTSQGKSKHRVYQHNHVVVFVPATPPRSMQQPDTFQISRHQQTSHAMTNGRARVKWVNTNLQTAWKYGQPIRCLPRGREFMNQQWSGSMPTTVLYHSPGGFRYESTHSQIVTHSLLTGHATREGPASNLSQHNTNQRAPINMMVQHVTLWQAVY